MNLAGWTYDLAREQSPSEADLAALFERSQEAGYDAVGLYLEHRFRYASAPWAAGEGALEPVAVKRLTERFRPSGLRVIPFTNTLGHVEGFLRTPEGAAFAEGPAPGQLSRQLCPSKPAAIEFARAAVDDVLAAFDDEWVHLGGDETRQLGQCPACAEREISIGKAGLYAEFYADLARRVLAKGRRPCLWGDMLLAHPQAMSALPRETLVFDWQYDARPGPTLRILREAGFDVVACPALHTYAASWCFLDRTRRNIDEHMEDARREGALGVFVTTWEAFGGSEYASVLPLVAAAGRRLARGEDWAEAIRREAGEGYLRAAEILGVEVPAAASFLAPGAFRQLRERLLLRQNPFLLWRDWRGEATGATGDRLLELLDAADRAAGRQSVLAFPIELHRVAVGWVREVESARLAYDLREYEIAASRIEAAERILGGLAAALDATSRAGGSKADPARLARARRFALEVASRVRALPRAASYRPSFEVLTHRAYIPGDQAAWPTGDDT